MGAEWSHDGLSPSRVPAGLTMLPTAWEGGMCVPVSHFKNWGSKRMSDWPGPHSW